MSSDLNDEEMKAVKAEEVRLNKIYCQELQRRIAYNEGYVSLSDFFRGPRILLSRG